MITLDYETHKPLYQQIYEQYRDQIMDGTYSAGSKLPPIRRLADDLEISRNTVEAAYLQLSQEGYVSSRTGSGFVVEKLDLLTEVTDASLEEASDMFKKRLRQTDLWVSESDEEGARGRRAEEPEIVYDFTYGNLSDGSFPSQLWRKLTNDELFGADANKASAYTNNLGEKKLREQIARTIRVQSGVNCHPAQVVVQAGTQASLANLLTLFDPLRDVIAMEEPGYDGVRSVFENARFRMFPIPVYEGNDAFISALYNSHASLAYVTPSNQFPTGTVLQLSARQRLLKWASSQNAYIIEDDYCREFRYTTRPLSSLRSLDRDDRVIYMGTFSKALSPALRINYLVLPPDLLFRWNKLFENYYPEVPWLSQAVLASYIEKGYWTKRLRKSLAQNKRKYQLLKSTLQASMGSRIEIMENGSGLHLLVGVLDGRHQNELIYAARHAGVKVYGTNRYWMNDKHPMENFVLVGFSAIAEDKIEAGIQKLAQAWFPE
jgi:GntR family transcriptional regulator/MocR family aminotransferase